MDKLEAPGRVHRSVRGSYCLLINLPADRRIAVGALGDHDFRSGVYLYVGSAMGGIAQRIRRHKSPHKKLRWHIDYLLASSEVVASVAICSNSKKTECEIVRELSESEQVSHPVRGFGSSDCRCDSHLLYFGDEDTARVMETLAMRLSMLRSVYPEVWA